MSEESRFFTVDIFCCFIRLQREKLCVQMAYQ